VSNADPISDGVQALSQFFVADHTVEQTLQRIVELSVVAVDHAAFAALTLDVDGRPGTPVFSDQDAPDIDSAQYAADSGPCLAAYRAGEVFTITDTATDPRWPEFCEAARAHGVRSTLSLPILGAEEARLGGLNLYARSVGEFPTQQVEAGELFAAQAGIVLSNAQAYWEARTLSENMAAAMQHRAVIEQAKGILMASTPGTSPDTAFAMLVSASQRENRKLRDIAADIVTARQTLADGTATPSLVDERSRAEPKGPEPAALQGSHRT